jgi:tetratricopeptide (TPR) repeat protein
MIYDELTTLERSERFGRPRRPVVAAIIMALVSFAAAGCEKPQSTGDLQLSFEHYQAGRYQEAITTAQAALATNPNSSEAYNNMAVSYLGLRMYDEAIKAAEEAIRLNPESQLAKNNLAWIQDEKAKAPSAPAQATTPAGALLNQSLAHARSGRFKECIDTAMEALKLEPMSAPAFNNIGFCSARLGRWDEGIRNAEEAVRLDPTFQLAKNNLDWMRKEAAKSR